MFQQYFKMFHCDWLCFVFLALRLDGVNVKGYTAFSLVDGLDWTSGYAARYGLYNVDFASVEKTRTPKTAAANYRCVNTDSVVLLLSDANACRSRWKTCHPKIVWHRIIVSAL